MEISPSNISGERNESTQAEPLSESLLFSLLDSLVKQAANDGTILSLTPNHMYAELARLAGIPFESIIQNTELKTKLKEQAKHLVHEVLGKQQDQKPVLVKAKQLTKSTELPADVNRKRPRRQQQVAAERSAKPSSVKSSSAKPPSAKKSSSKTSSAPSSAVGSLKQKLTKLIKICKLPPSIYKGLDKTDEIGYVKALEVEVARALCKKGIIKDSDESLTLPTINQAKEWARKNELDMELAELGLSVAKGEVLRPRSRRRVCYTDEDDSSDESSSSSSSSSDASVQRDEEEDRYSSSESDHSLSPR